MEVLVFCNGQMFGEERHLLISQKKRELGLNHDESITGKGIKDEMSYEVYENIKKSTPAPFSI